MTNFDLIIVGGGILGSAAAFFATRAGFKTALIEKRSALASHTTSKAVSCFRRQWDEPDFLYLVGNSIDVYEHFGEITALGDYDIGLRQQGWLFATAAAEGAERLGRWVQGMRGLGVTDSEYLTGDQARARFSFLSPEVTAATFRAKDGWLSPYEAASGFVRAGKAAGLTPLLDTEVTRIQFGSNRVTGVETGAGTLFAPRVVVCAGPHSKVFAEQCGLTLPVTLLRRQRAFIATRDRVPSGAPMVADSDTGAYWRPEAGGAFLGWAEDEPPGPPLDDVPADSDFAAVVLDACGRLSPFWREAAETLRAGDVKVAAGQYSVTADSKPLIGASAVEGLYFLTGDNGFGIEAGPQAARHLVRLLTGELSEADNVFRLDRKIGKTAKIIL